MKNNLRVLPLSGTATAAVAALLFSPLFAQASDFTDSAQVISSSPIIERVREERQDCSNAPPPQAASQRERSFAGSIVGGLAGALLGHGFVSTQCDGNCALQSGIGMFVGSILIAGGTAIIAVLVLRAHGEWRESTDPS